MMETKGQTEREAKSDTDEMKEGQRVHMQRKRREERENKERGIRREDVHRMLLPWVQLIRILVSHLYMLTLIVY